MTSLKKSEKIPQAPDPFCAVQPYRHERWHPCDHHSLAAIRMVRRPKGGQTRQDVHCCPLCFGNFHAPTLDLLLEHYKTVHWDRRKRCGRYVLFPCRRRPDEEVLRGKVKPVKVVREKACEALEHFHCPFAGCEEKTFKSPEQVVKHYKEEHEGEGGGFGEDGETESGGGCIFDSRSLLYGGCELILGLRDHSGGSEGPSQAAEREGGKAVCPPVCFSPTASSVVPPKETDKDKETPSAASSCSMKPEEQEEEGPQGSGPPAASDSSETCVQVPVGEKEEPVAVSPPALVSPRQARLEAELKKGQAEEKGEGEGGGVSANQQNCARPRRKIKFLNVVKALPFPIERWQLENEGHKGQGPTAASKEDPQQQQPPAGDREQEKGSKAAKDVVKEEGESSSVEAGGSSSAPVASSSGLGMSGHSSKQAEAGGSVTKEESVGVKKEETEEKQGEVQRTGWREGSLGGRGRSGVSSSLSVLIPPGPPNGGVRGSSNLLLSPSPSCPSASPSPSQSPCPSEMEETDGHGGEDEEAEAIERAEQDAVMHSSLFQKIAHRITQQDGGGGKGKPHSLPPRSPPPRTSTQSFMPQPVSPRRSPRFAPSRPPPIETMEAQLNLSHIVVNSPAFGADAPPDNLTEKQSGTAGEGGVTGSSDSLSLCLDSPVLPCPGGSENGSEEVPQNGEGSRRRVNRGSGGGVFVTSSGAPGYHLPLSSIVSGSLQPRPERREGEGEGWDLQMDSPKSDEGGEREALATPPFSPVSRCGSIELRLDEDDDEICGDEDRGDADTRMSDSSPFPSLALDSTRKDEKSLESPNKEEPSKFHSETVEQEDPADITEDARQIPPSPCRRSFHRSVITFEALLSEEHYEPLKVPLHEPAHRNPIPGGALRSCIKRTFCEISSKDRAFIEAMPPCGETGIGGGGKAKAKGAQSSAARERAQATRAAGLPPLPRRVPPLPSLEETGSEGEGEGLTASPPKNSRPVTRGLKRQAAASVTQQQQPDGKETEKATRRSSRIVNRRPVSVSGDTSDSVSQTLPSRASAPGTHRRSVGRPAAVRLPLSSAPRGSGEEDSSEADSDDSPLSMVFVPPPEISGNTNAKPRTQSENPADGSTPFDDQHRQMPQVRIALDAPARIEEAKDGLVDSDEDSKEQQVRPITRGRGRPRGRPPLIPPKAGGGGRGTAVAAAAAAAPGPSSVLPRGPPHSTRGRAGKRIPEWALDDSSGRRGTGDDSDDDWKSPIGVERVGMDRNRVGGEDSPLTFGSSPSPPSRRSSPRLSGRPPTPCFPSFDFGPLRRNASLPSHPGQLPRCVGGEKTEEEGVSASMTGETQGDPISSGCVSEEEEEQTEKLVSRRLRVGLRASNRVGQRKPETKEGGEGTENASEEEEVRRKPPVRSSPRRLPPSSRLKSSEEGDTVKDGNGDKEAEGQEGASSASSSAASSISLFKSVSSRKRRNVREERANGDGEREEGGEKPEGEEPVSETERGGKESPPFLSPPPPQRTRAQARRPSKLQTRQMPPRSMEHQHSMSGTFPHIGLKRQPLPYSHPPPYAGPPAAAAAEGAPRPPPDFSSQNHNYNQMSPAPMPMGFPYPGFAPHGMQPGGPFIAIRGPPEAEGVGPSSSSGGFEGDGDKERGEGEKNDQEEDEDLSSFHSCRSSLSRGPDQLESADPSAPSSLLPLDSMRAQPYGQKSHSALPNVFPRYNEGTQGDTFAAVRGGSSFRRDKMHHPSAGALPQVKIPTRPSGSSSQFPSKLQPRGSLRGGAPAQRGPPPPQWPPHLLPRFEGDQSSFSSASAFAGQGGPRFVSVDTGHVPSAAAASSRQLHVPPHGCNNPSPRESRGPARSPIAPVPTQSFYNKKDAGAPPAAEGGGTGLLKMMRNKKRPAEGPPPPVENPGGESSSSSASSSSSSHGVGLSAGGGVGGSTWHEFRDRTSVGSMQTENSTVMDLSSRLDLFKKRKLGGSQGNFPGGKEKEKKKKPPPNAKKEKKEKDKNRPTGSKSGTNLNKEKEARRPSLSVSARLSQESRSGSLSGQGGRKVKTRAPKRHAVPLAGPASAAIRVNAAQAASAALSSSHPHNPQQQQQASSAPGPQPRPPLPSSKSSSRPRTRESILAKGTRLRPQNTLRQTQRMNMSPSLTVGGGRRATLAPPSPSSSQQQQASASSGGGLKKPGGRGGGRGEMPKMAAAGGSAAGGPRPTRGRRRGRGAAAAVGRPPKIPAPPTTTASAPQSSSLAPPTTELHRQQKETKEPPQTETERLCVSSQQRRGVSVPASPSTRRRVRMGGPGPPDESPACAAAPLSLNAAAVGGGGDGLEKGGQSSRERECVSPSAEPENRCPTGSRAGGGGGGEAATFCQQKGAPRIQLGEMPGPLGGSNGAQQQQGAEGDSCPPISPRCGGNGKGGTGGRSPRLGRSPRGGTRASVFPPALSVDVPSAPGGAPSEAPHALVEGEGPRTGSSTDTAAGSTVAPAAMEVESDALADQKRKGGRAQDGANVKGDNEEEEGEEEKDVSPSASASPSSASGTGGQADIASRPLEVSS